MPLLQSDKEGVLQATTLLEELERLYMQAAAVVDNLSSKIMVGGTEEGIVQHLGKWMSIQKEMGFI